MKTIANVTKGPLGKICWGVEYDRQLGLSMSFGVPRLKIREPYLSKSPHQRIRENASYRKVMVRGNWWLWIFCAYWKIVIPHSATASSSSPLRVKRLAMARLSGQRLQAIRVNAKHGATEFAFDLGAIVQARRMEKESDADIWTLYKPNGYVVGVRGDGKFTHAKGTKPGREIVPIALKGSPALEAALLEGVRSPHRPYGKATVNRIRNAARNGK